MTLLYFRSAQHEGVEIISNDQCHRVTPSWIGFTVTSVCLNPPSLWSTSALEQYPRHTYRTHSRVFSYFNYQQPPNFILLTSISQTVGNVLLRPHYIDLRSRRF